MIALYKGVSFWPSRVIEFINWSEYSHAAWIDEENDTCIEAWMPGGVRHVCDFKERHTSGTVVDFFIVDALDRTVIESKVRAFLLTQLGKGYDYGGIVHFLTRRPESAGSQTKWFCSELVAEAYRRAGCPLFFRIPSFKVYPGMIAYSPKLIQVGSKKV